jgi:hypothetical protein
MTPRTAATVPAGEELEPATTTHFEEGMVHSTISEMSNGKVLTVHEVLCTCSLISLTHSHTNFSTGHSQTNIIGQGHVDAEHSRVVEELAKDHLTIWGGCHVATDGLHRRDAVFV